MASQCQKSLRSLPAYLLLVLLRAALCCLLFSPSCSHFFLLFWARLRTLFRSLLCSLQFRRFCMTPCPSMGLSACCFSSAFLPLWSARSFPFVSNRMVWGLDKLSATRDRDTYVSACRVISGASFKLHMPFAQDGAQQAGRSVGREKSGGRKFGQENSKEKLGQKSGKRAGKAAKGKWGEQSGATSWLLGWSGT